MPTSRFVWVELMTGDVASAAAFHSGVVGWQAQALGLPGMDFRVDAIEAAAQRVVRLGGTVTTGPDQVPGGGWVLHARDPQGAMFALMSAAK